MDIHAGAHDILDIHGGARLPPVQIHMTGGRFFYYRCCLSLALLDMI